MRNFLLAHRYPRWTRRTLFWALSTVLGLFLLMPPFLEGKLEGFLVLGVFLFAVLLWLTDVLHTEKFSEIPFGPALLGLALIRGITVVFSKDPAVSLNPLAMDFSVYTLLLIAYMSGRTMRNLVPALSGIFWVGVLLAAYGIFQHFGGLENTYQALFHTRPVLSHLEHAAADRLTSGRAFSLFVYPNLLAGFLGMLIPLGLSLGLSQQGRRSRLLYALGVVVLFGGLFVTGSLGGWITMGLGVGVYVFSLQSRLVKATPLFKRGWVWAATALFLASSFAILVWLRGAENIGNDLTVRWVNWGSAWHMACDHWLTGVGPELFGNTFPDYQSPHGSYVRYAHNFLLHEFAETGLLGVLAILGFVVVVVRQVLEKFKHLERLDQRVLAVGLISGLLVGVTHALIDVDFNFLKIRAVFWFLLGALLGLIQPAKPAAPREIPSFEPLIQLGLAAVSLLVLWKGGRSLTLQGLLSGGVAGLLMLVLVDRLNIVVSWEQFLRRIPLRWPLALLVVWSVLSAMTSAYPVGAIPGLSLVLLGLAVYLITVLTPRVSGFLMPSLGVGAVGLAMVVLVQNGFHNTLRVAAGWPNPNLLAGFLCLGLLGQLTAFLLEPATLPWRLTRAFASLIIFAGLLATGSMAGILNLAVGLVVLLILIAGAKPQMAKMTSLVLGGLLVLSFILPFPTSNRLLDLRNYQGQAYERVGMARAAIKMLVEHPLTGAGPGNFSQAFERYSFPNVRGLARFGKTTEFAHNEWLQMVALCGLPAGLIILWMLWSLYQYFRRQCKIRLDREQPLEAREHIQRMMAWAGLAGGCAQGLVDFNWHVPALFLWYMLLLGMVVSPTGRGKPSETFSALLRLDYWRATFRGLTRQVTAVLCLFLMFTVVTALLRPLLSQYLQNLGQAYRFKQDLKAATRVFEQALYVMPLSAEVYDQLGQVRLDVYALVGTDNWFQLSEWAFQKALGMDRLNAYTHRHMGILYSLKASRLSGEERQQQYDQAEQAYHQAIAKAPNKALLYFELGNILRDAERYGEAERAWRKAIELEPNYASAWSNLGVVEEMRGDLKLAEESFCQALRLKTKSAAVQDKYEMELLSLNWGVVHYNLGQLYERSRRWADARAQYQEILLSEPNNLAVQRRLENLKKNHP